MCCASRGASCSGHSASAGSIEANSTVVYDYDFAKTVEPWEPISESGRITADTLKIKSEATGNTYAALTEKTKGIVAILASFGNTGNTVRVKFQARNVEGCSACVPIVYVGNGKPTNFADFVRVGGPFGITADKTAISWNTYVFEKPIKGTVTVAVGYLNVEGKPAWAGVDNISVTTSVR
jgi:hypothetical protein